MNELYQDDIPELYSTERVPFDRKTIFQRYRLRRPVMGDGLFHDLRGFNWLLAELDKQEMLAFGYANLNDDQNAEWGLVYLPDMMRVGAVRDRRWKPLPFPEAKRLVYGYRQPLGSREHHDWWLYENRDQLMKEHRLLGHRMVFREYEERAYRVEFGRA